MSGGVGERLKPAVLKTVRLERVSGVRIPPPPPEYSQSSLLANYHFQSFRRPKSLSRFIPIQELPAQRSAKPLGSASTNKATVCETVVARTVPAPGVSPFTFSPAQSPNNK